MLSALKLARIRHRAETGKPLASNVFALLADRAELAAQRDHARQGWQRAVSASGYALLADRSAMAARTAERDTALAKADKYRRAAHAAAAQLDALRRRAAQAEAAADRAIGALAQAGGIRS